MFTLNTLICFSFASLRDKLHWLQLTSSHMSLIRVHFPLLCITCVFYFLIIFIILKYSIIYKRFNWDFSHIITPPLHVQVLEKTLSRGHLALLLLLHIHYINYFRYRPLLLEPVHIPPILLGLIMPLES